MQEILFARYEGPRVSDYPGTQRLLESVDGLVIEQHGRVVARMFGHRHIVGNQSFSVHPRVFHFNTDGLDWVSMRVYACQKLVWSHAGAMCALQGMPVEAVLGAGWIVVDGKPTVPGDPLPGLVMPILAEVFDNQAYRPNREIFSLVREALGL